MSRRNTISYLSPYAQEYSPTSPESIFTPSTGHYTPTRSTAASTPYIHDPSYTNSRTWVSPRIRERDEWKRVNEGLHTMNLNHPDHSPFVPKSFDEYLQHKADFLNDRKQEMQAKCGAAAVANGPVGKALEGIYPGDGGDGRGAVLAEETIWCPWDEPTEHHPQAPWPCKEEMREEGDERHTSQFGRFMALPRNPGNETVSYKHRSPIKQHHMDRVWEVTHPDDIPEDFEQEEMESRIGESLMRELDR
ncbi:MAG: hypothetical protein LQ343_000397 [Gyalolechia ehrenbergii]|nr:MAG: hypothetical protein LQ343_000397 [Gyalolechia ehrenbergii]